MATASGPVNWHSDAFLASGIWQPNDEHKLTSTFDYYHKTNHTHYDTWDSSGNSTIGTANQTSQTRRWGLSLFWHFLDVVWICVFTVVYLMGTL